MKINQKSGPRGAVADPGRLAGQAGSPRQDFDLFLLKFVYFPAYTLFWIFMVFIIIKAVMVIIIIIM